MQSIFNDVFINNSFNYISNQVTKNLTPLQKKVAVFVTACFSLIALGYFAFRCFCTKKEIDQVDISNKNLEDPNKIANTTIVAKGKDFEKIRNSVRSAIKEFCIGSENLNLRERQLFIRADGSYTLNLHEDDIIYLGNVHYKIEDFKITRLVIGQGFKDAPEVKAAFEGHDH